MLNQRLSALPRYFLAEPTVRSAGSRTSASPRTHGSPKPRVPNVNPNVSGKLRSALLLNEFFSRSRLSWRLSSLPGRQTRLGIFTPQQILYTLHTVELGRRRWRPVIKCGFGASIVWQPPDLCLLVRVVPPLVRHGHKLRSQSKGRGLFLSRLGLR
jgi:hypothetical protein